MRSRALLFAVGVLWPAAFALAWPVDAYVDVEVDADKIVRLEGANWVEVEDARIAGAELFSESGELLLSGHAPGRTLVLFSREGRVFAWRVRVSKKGGKVPVEHAPSLLQTAKSACPSLTSEANAARIQVASEKCRLALTELFKADDFRADEVELTFEVPALQAQLVALDAALGRLGKEKPTAQYLGAGLVLKGKMSEGAHRKALWQVFFNSIGALALDDQVEVEPKETPSVGGQQ